jgi:hypothetical protein
MTTPRDLRPLLRVVAGDLDIFLKSSPDAFDALLFRALRDQVEQVTDVVDQVGSMEASEKIIEYADPDPVRAFELPFDFPVAVDDEGESASGYSDQPVTALIDAADIPKASVLVYDEYDDLTDKTTRRVLYVERVESISKKPGAGSIYFMLPFFDFDERFMA